MKKFLAFLSLSFAICLPLHAWPTFTTDSFLGLRDTPDSYLGESGNCVAVNGTETGLEFVTCGAGGGSPGGADTNIQFKDGSSFGGDAGFTYNKTTNTIALGDGDFGNSGFGQMGAEITSQSDQWTLAFRTATGGTIDAPNFLYMTSRGTLASPTIVADADALGSDYYYAYDGTDFKIAAVARVVVDGTPGLNDMGASFHWAVSSDGGVTPSTTFSIDETRNIGIQQSTPEAQLDIWDSGSRGVNIGYTTERIALRLVPGTKGIADGTSLTDWRSIQFGKPTINGVAGGGSESVTNGTTVYIEGAATQGTNITLSNPYALWVDDGTSRFDGLGLFNAKLDIKNGSTSSGVLAIYEDSDAGTNKATFQVPSLGADTVYILPADDGDAGEQLQTNGSGTLTWEAAGGAGSTAWNDIGDATADGTIDLAATETDFTSTLDSAGKAIWTITNTDADTAADTDFISLAHNDGADANIFYFRAVGDLDGTPQTDYRFSQTAALIRPDLTVTGTIGTTGGLTLDAQTEANIEAGVDLAGEVTATDLDTTVIGDNITVTGWALGTIASGVGTALTALDGENIQDDTIDDDSIDFSDVTGADLTLTDAVAVTTSGKIISNANLDIKNGATSSGVLAIYEDSDAGTEKATFQVPSLSADTAYILPSDDGDAGEQLQTNGSGTLSWEAKEAITAGDYITRTTDDLDIDAEVITDTKCIWWENPVAGDDFKSIFVNDMPTTLTVTKLWCESDQTVNTMLQVDDGSAADMDGTDLACVSTPDTDTSLDGDATIAAGDRVDVDVASVSGTPTWVSICFTYTKAD